MKLIALSPDGHRREYVLQFTAELKAAGLASSATDRVEPLERSPLFFLAIEDHPAVFAGVAAIRSLLGRRTVGLLFRPGPCFTPRSLRHTLKRVAFRILSRLPDTHVLTLLPHDLDARFSLVSNGWLFDPQLWDLATHNRLTTNPPCELQEEVKRKAAGRKIVVALGDQQRNKGFEFLSDVIRSTAFPRDEIAVVAAGRVAAGSKHSATMFSSAGGILYDRLLSDAEFIGMYAVADLVWNCYSSRYDQASGVFGRAVQLGVPSVVRKGSYLERLAGILEHPILAVDEGDVKAAIAAITRSNVERPDPATVAERIERIRNVSIDVLLTALDGEATRA